MKPLFALISPFILALAAQAQTPSPTPDDYADLTRIDKYENLKRQRVLLENATNLIAINNRVVDTSGFSELLIAIIKKEQARNIQSYTALIEVSRKILEAKTDADYDALNEQEKIVLADIETNKMRDRADVKQFRFDISERDAALLEIVQRHQ